MVRQAVEDASQTEAPSRKRTLVQLSDDSDDDGITVLQRPPPDLRLSPSSKRSAAQTEATAEAGPSAFKESTPILVGGVRLQALEDPPSRPPEQSSEESLLVPQEDSFAPEPLPAPQASPILQPPSSKAAPEPVNKASAAAAISAASRSPKHARREGPTPSRTIGTQTRGLPVTSASPSEPGDDVDLNNGNHRPHRGEARIPTKQAGRPLRIIPSASEVTETAFGAPMSRIGSDRGSTHAGDRDSVAASERLVNDRKEEYKANIARLCRKFRITPKQLIGIVNRIPKSSHSGVMYWEDVEEKVATVLYR